MRHTFNALAMELRIPCIKPLKLYIVDGNRNIRRSYKIDAKKTGLFFVSWHSLQHFLKRQSRRYSTMDLEAHSYEIHTKDVRDHIHV